MPSTPVDNLWFCSYYSGSKLWIYNPYHSSWQWLSVRSRHNIEYFQNIGKRQPIFRLGDWGMLSVLCESKVCSVIYHCPWWRHQMETFSASLAFCVGNSPVTGWFPSIGQWREGLMFYLFCVWINAWVNNREAGDLRRHCANYDAMVMPLLCFFAIS